MLFRSFDIIEDILPLHDIPLSLRLAKSPRRVYLAPTMQEVDFVYRDGHAELQVPEVHGHQMVVFE